MFGYKLIKAADYNTMNLLQKKNKAQHELICKQHCENKQLQETICMYVEALEQQTKEKQELQTVLNNYRECIQNDIKTIERLIERQVTLEDTILELRSEIHKYQKFNDRRNIGGEYKDPENSDLLQGW